MAVGDDDFDCRSLTEEEASDGSYISIHDLLDPPPLHGGSSSSGAREIRIKNRLVKRAAYAYLQPTHSMADYHDHRLRHRRSLRRVIAVLTCGLAGQPTHSMAEYHDRRRRSLRRVIAVLTCGLAGEPLLSCIDSFLRLFRRAPR